MSAPGSGCTGRQAHTPTPPTSLIFGSPVYRASCPSTQSSAPQAPLDGRMGTVVHGGLGETELGALPAPRDSLIGHLSAPLQNRVDRKGDAVRRPREVTAGCCPLWIPLLLREVWAQCRSGSFTHGGAVGRWGVSGTGISWPKVGRWLVSEVAGFLDPRPSPPHRSALTSTP